MKYVEKYLKPNMRVLEIGAATGRYSHALAQKGYRVDAVELVEHNIEIFKQNTIEGEPVTITQGNAMDLSAFESDTYDITLLLGPMYHLFTREDTHPFGICRHRLLHHLRELFDLLPTALGVLGQYPELLIHLRGDILFGRQRFQGLLYLRKHIYLRIHRRDQRLPVHVHDRRTGDGGFRFLDLRSRRTLQILSRFLAVF